MKKLIFLLLFYLFCENANAQAFFVGDTSCNYHKVNYNFSSMNCSTPWQPALSAYTIDINGDLTSDIEIWNYCFYDPGSGGSASDNKRKYIRSATGYEFGYGPSVLSPCPQTSVIKNYSYGTILNASINWSVTSASFPYGGSDIYYWHNDFMTPIASCTCGLLANTFYIAFRKTTSTDTIYGWVLIDSYWPGQVTSYAFKRSPLLNSPVFTNTLTSICQGSTLNLTANPTGGIFNGSGVSGSVFNSSITGTGIQQVFYTNGCTNAATLNITVNPLPTPAFTNTISSICPGDTLILNATPSGGTLTGTGVIGNVFHSAVTGPGIQQVYYTCINGFGCTKTATMNITVTAPIVSVNSNCLLSCAGQSVVLSASGANTYTWASGPSTNSIVVSPTTSTSYTVTGTSVIGCTNTTVFNQAVGNPTINLTTSSTNSLLCPGQTATVTANGAITYTWNTGATTQNLIISPTSNISYTVVGALTSSGGCSVSTIFNQAVGNPTISVATNTPNICKNDAAILTSTGAAANYLWSNGAITTTCVVTPTVTTTYSLIASNPGGCADTAFVTQVVAPTLSITTVSNQSVLCEGDSAILTMSGSTWYNGCNSTQPVCFLVWTNTASINPIVTDTYTIIGTSSINGCDAVGYFTQIVSACYNEINFTIFPNPNSGAFEIKGIREETIFITNELGQLIAEKYLSKENNYSVKLFNLQSGVYFVGNNFVRQKIVVIR